jgi:hypothetical protein
VRFPRDTKDSDLVVLFGENAAAVRELLQLITVQQGPGEVLVAKKERVDPGLPGAEVVAVINCIERALKARRAEVRWCFVEPAEHV